MRAVEGNDINGVSRLLREGANPNHQWFWDEHRTPPLHEACRSGFLVIVELLVDGKADPNRGDGLDNWTPLHYACESGKKDVVQYLVRDLNCKPGEGY